MSKTRTISVHWGMHPSERKLVRVNPVLDGWETALLAWHEEKLATIGEEVVYSKLFAGATQGFLLDIGHMIAPTRAANLQRALGVSYSVLLENKMMEIDPIHTYMSLREWCDANGTSYAIQMVHCLRQRLESIHAEDLPEINKKMRRMASN